MPLSEKAETAPRPTTHRSLHNNIAKHTPKLSPQFNSHPTWKGLLQLRGKPRYVRTTRGCTSNLSMCVRISQQPRTDQTRQKGRKVGRKYVRGNVCNSKRTPRGQDLRQGCLTSSTGFLAGTQAHFKHDSATEHVSDSFELTFPEKSRFPGVAVAHPAVQYTAVARASQSIPPLRLWLQSQSTSHHTSFLPGRNSTSQGKASPFLWIWLWATRCRCSCTH